MPLPKTFKLALAEFGAEGAFDPLAPAEAENHLGFTVEPQKGDQWCWAAVSVSLRALLRSDLPPLQQCRLAEIVLPGGLNCCDGSDEAPPVCDKAAFLDDGLSAAGVAANRNDSPLSFHDVREQIDQQRPVACRIDFAPPRLPHFVVIEGYIEGDDRQYSVTDPLRGKGMMDVATFESNYAHEGGLWAATFRMA